MSDSLSSQIGEAVEQEAQASSVQVARAAPRLIALAVWVERASYARAVLAYAYHWCTQGRSTGTSPPLVAAGAAEVREKVVMLVVGVGAD